LAKLAIIHIAEREAQGLRKIVAFFNQSSGFLLRRICPLMQVKGQALTGVQVQDQGYPQSLLDGKQAEIRRGLLGGKPRQSHLDRTQRALQVKDLRCRNIETYDLFAPVEHPVLLKLSSTPRIRSAA
jgi:hypothetical protein